MIEKSAIAMKNPLKVCFNFMQPRREQPTRSIQSPQNTKFLLSPFRS